MATVIKPKRSETALAVPSASDLEVGELALNVTDGKFYVKKTDNSVKEVGGAGSVTLNDVVTNGGFTTSDILLDQGANLIFEGNLANAYETILTVAEPTADRTLTLPNASGTIALTSDVTSGSITIQDEGSSLSTQATTLNFVGAGVTASGTGTTKTITISGGGGSGSSAADDITAGDAAVNITTTSGNITIDAQANDSDIIFKGTDGGSDTTFLTLDGSAGGTATFNSNVLAPVIQTGNINDTTKFRYWNSATDFCSGFTFGYTYGGLGDSSGDGYAINWSNSDENHRGFIWDRSSHSKAQGAMALTTNGKLTVAHSIRVGYGESDTTTPGATHTLDVSGSFAATTKSFDIEHPTLDNMRLRYGVLEGPEHGVYVRGKLENNSVIELPEHWLGLVDEDTITVQLTPNSKHQKLYVKEIKDNKIKIGNSSLLSKINCYYFVQATRKDVDRLEVEYEN